MLIYSGHDGRLLNQNPNELDKQTDEIWYLYDIQLVDDELNKINILSNYTKFTTVFITNKE